MGSTRDKCYTLSGCHNGNHSVSESLNYAIVNHITGEGMFLTCLKHLRLILLNTCGLIVKISPKKSLVVKEGCCGLVDLWRYFHPLKASL